MTVSVIEYDRAAAERRAERITLRLDAIADNYAAVMPMIREAIEKRDDIALGYNSPGDYVRDRFGGSLQRLGVDTCRTVTKELTAAGLSSRAIAPVIGKSDRQVRNYQAQVGNISHLDEPDALVNTETGEVSDDYVTDQADLDNPTDDETSGEVTPSDEDVPASDDSGVTAPSERDGKASPPRRSVTGLDGKEYTRPAPSKPKRKPLTDAFRDATYDLTKVTERIERLSTDDRFPRNANEVAGRNLNYLVRARDLLSQVIEELNN